jgi:FkbM family methyltransferase
MSRLDHWARSMIPQHMRARLRRSGAVNTLLAWRYGGPRHKRHPHAPYEFYFDGYRNIGWAAGDLAGMEGGEIHFVQDLLRQRPCRCAWDVGANVGFWSVFLAGIEPPIERIYAFEPDPTNLHWLRMNQGKNHLDRLVIREVGLSDQAGEATFFADEVTGSTGSLEKEADFIGRQYGKARREITIGLSTIDQEVQSGAVPPDFMKIDVEGHELNVLMGARRTLADHKPMLILEVTRHHDEVGDLLTGLGYRLIDPHSGKPLQRPQFATAAIGTIQAGTGTTTLGQPLANRE